MRRAVGRPVLAPYKSTVLCCLCIEASEIYLEKMDTIVCFIHLFRDEEARGLVYCLLTLNIFFPFDPGSLDL